MCNGPYGETCPLMEKALYLNSQRSHPKFSKDLVGRGHSKPRGTSAVCKPTVNNSNIKVLLNPYKHNILNNGPIMLQALLIWFCGFQDCE